MDPIACARAFIERCQNREPVDQLTAAFELAVQRIGFRLFACVSHTDPSASVPGAVLVHNFPNPWVRVYNESRLHSIDAVMIHADRSHLPFLWESDELKQQLTLEQQEMFAAARSFGIENGYTIPIHMPRILGIPNGSCSVVPATESLNPASYLAVAVMAPYFYHALSRSEAHADRPCAILTRRQRECLALVAQGKDDWTIGRLLKLSEHTVHAYLEDAKLRLRVTTRAQAVAEALMSGQLSATECRTIRQRELSQLPETRVNPPV
jgi:DNA-binding CsgD family transcriptional regulator